jgi:novobiocin biosynthesis protein NovU/D-mycarose 3-C-methyltransferase
MIEVALETRTTCRGCGAATLELVLDYGPMPLAGAFPRADELDDERAYPLHLVVCSGCGLAQVPQVVPQDVLFRDYRYRASVPLARHFEAYADSVPQRLGLRPDGLIVEPGCNDGVLLEPLRRRGFHELLGVDPAENITAHVPDGIPVRSSYFDPAAAGAILAERGPAQLVTANNVFAHMDEPVEFACAAALLLEPEGVFAFEVHYLADLVDRFQYDTVYHEHVLYYSLTALAPLLARAGLRIFDTERIANHGGSVRVFACREDARREATAELAELLRAERARGLDQVSAFEDFGRGVRDRIARLDAAIARAAQRHTIAAYGAAGRATILFNACREAAGHVAYVVDESPERAGRVMPGTHNEIVAPERLDAEPPGLLLISAWSYAEPIRAKVRDRLGAGAPEFWVPLPEPGPL